LYKETGQKQYNGIPLLGHDLRLLNNLIADL